MQRRLVPRSSSSQRERRRSSLSMPQNVSLIESQESWKSVSHLTPSSEELIRRRHSVVGPNGLCLGGMDGSRGMSRRPSIGSGTRRVYVCTDNGQSSASPSRKLSSGPGEPEGGHLEHNLFRIKIFVVCFVLALLFYVTSLLIRSHMSISNVS